MKRYIALFMSILLVFLTVPTSFALDVATTMKPLFKDDFEKGILGEELSGWTQGRNGGGITHKYGIDPKNPNNQVLCIDRTVKVGDSEYNEKGIALGKVSQSAQDYQKDIIMEFRFLFDENSGSPGFTIRHRKDDAAKTEFYFGPGQVQILDYGRLVWIFDYDSIKSNQWNTIRVLFKYDGRYSMWINDEIVSGDNGAAQDLMTAFNPSENGGMDTLYINFGPSIGKMYIDDMCVYSDFTSELEAAASALTYDQISNGQHKESVRDNLELITSITHDGKTYPVEWESSDENFISSNGTVTQKSFPRDVKLTAKVYQNEKKDAYAQKNFDVTVIEAEGASDEVKLAEYAEMYIYEEAFTDEDKNKITKNLSPLAEGFSGITVEWSSDEPDVIAVPEGTVVRPAYDDARIVDGKVQVNLTAELMLNDKTISKTITYYVAATPNPFKLIDEAMAEVTYEVLSDEERTKIRKNLNLPKSHKNGTKIEWSSEPDVISSDGVVTRGSEKVDTILTATFSYAGESLTKTFNFTILPSVEAMLDYDVSQIDTTGFSALIKSFTLPLSGKLYGTEFSWKSENKAIVINGNRATVYRPLYNEGDITFNITLTAKNEETEITRSFPVTVLRDISDAEIVEKALEEIVFEKISTEAQNAVTKNLSLPTLIDETVAVEWFSSDEKVVTKKGEVFRPLKGEDPKEITLEAVLKKNYTEISAEPITFMVLAYETDEELLDDAKNSLLFEKLTDEPIEEVTSNLYLPTEWRSCSVKWKTSDEELLAISGTEGIVTRPKWGVSSETVTLTAMLTYGGLSCERSFLVRILEEDYMQMTKTQFNEDFEAWTDDSLTQRTEGASWYRLTQQAQTYVGADPLDSENQVFVYDRIGNSYSGTEYIYCESNIPLSGIVYMNVDVLLDSDMCSGVVVEARCATHTQAYIGIGESGVGASGYKFETPDEIIKHKDWNKLTIEANVSKKKFHVYLNDVLLTGNGNVTLADGTPYDSTDGLKYLNYADPMIDSTMKMFRFLIDKGEIAMLDNLNMTQKLVYTEEQLNLASNWERQFLSQNNISAITKDLVLPDIWQDGYVISYETSDSSVIDAAGRFNLEGGEKDIVFTLLVIDDATTYKKSYTLHAIKGDKEILTDEEAVTADALWAMNYLKKNYMLTGIDKNITFPTKGENGSIISVISSDTDVISNQGIITRGNSDQTVTLIIKATKNGSESTENLSATVAKKQTVKPSTSEPSTVGGGGAIKVTKGEQTKGDTGVDIVQPGDDEKDESEFRDVPKEHWAYSELKYMVDNKIMLGTGNGNMEPDRNIKREEFIKMLVGAMNIDLDNENAAFIDVQPDAWYAPYIAAAKKAGLVKGYEDGRVGIGENITREDMAVMISRAANLTEIKDDEEFKDDSLISEYAKNAVYALRKMGVINGMGDGSFAPKNNATRAQTASMLYKAVKKELFN